jgi:hypothetical protein
LRPCDVDCASFVKKLPVIQALPVPGPNLGDAIPQGQDFCPSVRGRLDAVETGRVLGFSAVSIRILDKAGLLKALGSPARYARKFYSASEVMAKSQDTQWLSRATRVVSRYWAVKNARRGSRPSKPSDPTV